MAALNGALDEWEQGEDGRWSRRDHPEDGVVSLREGLNFKDYYAMRAEPDPPPEPDPRDVKIADIEVRIAAIESARTITRT